MSHLLKQFRRDIIGLVWLSIGIFILMALYSYTPTDPSLNSIGKSLSVQNFCGYLGSFLSDALYQLLGLAAWILPLAAFKQSLSVFRDEKKTKGSFRNLWAALLVVSLASLVSVYFPDSKIFSGQIALGGLLGMSFSNLMLTALNSVGVQIVLWTCIISLTIFYTEKSLPELFVGFRWVFQLIGKMLSKTTLLKAVIPYFQAKIVGFKYKRTKSRLAKQTKAASHSKASIGRDDLSKPVKRGEQTFFPIAERMEVQPDFEEQEYDEEEYEEEYEEVFDEEPEELETSTRRRKVQLKKKIQHHVENWQLPKISLLEDPPYGRKRVDDREIRGKSDILLNKLQQFGVDGEVVAARPGPAVTMFEFKPNTDVKISSITQLADDLSLALSAESLRIIAPIPGRDVVGIETSNAARETVYLKDILASNEFWDEKTALPLAVGCQADGNQKIVDLRKMPHMLVAGSTGSGKSVFIVSLLTGLIFRHSPKTLRLILVDPKQVDLDAFSDIPHLMMPVVRDPRQAVGSLRWSIKEMEKRYRSMRKFSARDLEGFNKKVAELSAEEIEEHEAANDTDAGVPKHETYYYTPQPYIVIVCEEFGDVMSVDKTNVEQSVVRLAQMARASGIHLVLAMQSPRKDVVTGLIKTNIPGRVSFKVASKTDSRIIIDESGAERLLARGDMLFVAPGTSKPVRHHGPWLSDGEVETVTEFWMDQAEPEYDALAMKVFEGNSESSAGEGGFDDEIMDDKYDEIVSFVSTQKAVSASLLQRRFRLGYPRAARLIEILESEGVVGPSNGSKPRAVLVNDLK